jgi:UDP:flavonoid glycosyltransferase YjiC (YdhE family)
MRHGTGDRLTRLVLDAARDAGVRVVLARNGSKIGEGIRESDDVFILRDYPIPHHVLFPRLRAAVHQGSWIATHLAAQAGIPQLVVPQASDQYLWSHVVRKNGLGPHGVDMNRITRAKLTAALEQLTSNQGYVARARELGERVRGIDGAKNAVRLFQARTAPEGRSLSRDGHPEASRSRRALARWSTGNAVWQEDEGEEAAGEG